jgi:hypothetical protein
MRSSNAALMAALMLASSDPTRIFEGRTYTSTSPQPKPRPQVQRLSAQTSKEIQEWNRAVEDRKAAKKARKLS